MSVLSRTGEKFFVRYAGVEFGVFSLIKMPSNLYKVQGSFILHYLHKVYHRKKSIVTTHDYKIK